MNNSPSDDWLSFDASSWPLWGARGALSTRRTEPTDVDRVLLGSSCGCYRYHVSSSLRV